MQKLPLRLWLEPVIRRAELDAALARLFKVPRSEVGDALRPGKPVALLVSCTPRGRGFRSEVRVDVDDRRVGAHLDALGLVRALTRRFGVRGLIAPPGGGPGNDWLLVCPDGRLVLALERPGAVDDSVALDDQVVPVACDPRTGTPLAPVPWRVR